MKAANFEFEWVQFSRIIVSPLISNFQNNSWKRFLRNFITLSAREQVCNFFKKCALRCWDWDASICLQCCNTKPLSLSCNPFIKWFLGPCLLRVQCCQLLMSQFENYRLFLSLRFYVKSKLVNSEYQNLQFWHI